MFIASGLLPRAREDVTRRRVGTGTPRRVAGLAQAEWVGGTHAEAEGGQDHEVEDREEESGLKITDLLPDPLPAVPETLEEPHEQPGKTSRKAGLDGYRT